MRVSRLKVGGPRVDPREWDGFDRQLGAIRLAVCRQSSPTRPISSTLLRLACAKARRLQASATGQTKRQRATKSNG